jgi:hypothetical protein
MIEDDIKDTLVEEIISFVKDYEWWRYDDNDDLYANDVNAEIELELNGLDYFINVNMSMIDYLTRYSGDYLTPPEVISNYSVSIYNVMISFYNEETEEEIVEKISTENIKKIESDVNNYINR